jgi:hypothetical protein
MDDARRAPVQDLGLVSSSFINDFSHSAHGGPLRTTCIQLKYLNRNYATESIILGPWSAAAEHTRFATSGHLRDVWQ